MPGSSVTVSSWNQYVGPEAITEGTKNMTGVFADPSLLPQNFKDLINAGTFAGATQADKDAINAIIGDPVEIQHFWDFGRRLDDMLKFLQHSLKTNKPVVFHATLSKGGAKKIEFKTINDSAGNVASYEVWFLDPEESARITVNYVM